MTHDRYGNRVDQIDLDPSWHWLLAGAVSRAIHSLPWREPRPGAHVVRAAMFMLWGNANDGVMCPISMTYAAVPALRDAAPELAAEWESRLTSTDYQHGALAGMAMTERQGGSDVRANITRAEPVGDDLYEIQRSQMVLLVSAVRRVPGARAGSRRSVVFSGASAVREWSSSA